MRSAIRFVPFMLCIILLSFCSDPAQPPVQKVELGDPVEMEFAPDTTSHEYTWEYYFFGDSPVASSLFRDIHVESDTNIWMVGDVQIDSVVLSIPHGIKQHRVTAIQWNGEDFTPYAMEGMKASGNIKTMSVYGVGGKESSVIIVGTLGLTEVRSDTMVFHDMRILNGMWSSQERTEMTRSGRQFIFGRPGFLAELKQSGPLTPMTIEKIELPTEVPVMTFAEAGPEDYYIGCWWQSSQEYHFWRRYRGELIEYRFAKEGKYTRDFCTALWASNDRIFAACHPYIYHQSIEDTTDRKFINTLDFIENPSYGMPLRMTGRANNDVFIVGHVGMVMHYNGKSCYIYPEILKDFSRVIFYDVAVTTNIVYIVGGGTVYGNPRAVLIVGTRK